MDFDLPPDDDPRRTEIREWLDAHPRAPMREVAEAGYVVPHWPRPWGLDADPVHQISALVRAHVRLHAAYPLLARVCNREMEALSPANRERVLAVRHDSEQIFQQVIERGARLGVFEAERPWLVVAAIGAMGIRVAEWWEPERGFTVEEVAEEYAEFAVRIVTGKRGRAKPK